ncbi:FKBP12-interacting protein of 37 kDa [Spatholobus suberectus]|nr:FKBP12-interacting protein of 37 kDa [Spatholobus suberectus]
MASPTHFDDDFDFGGGFGGRHSGNKRSSPDYDDEDYDNDPFAPKKAKSKAEEASGVTTGMILSLRESLQNCRDTLATCQSAVRDLKVQLKPPSMLARRLLLDPAVHEEFTRLKNLVEEKDKKVKELQDNIAAVSFTPQSKMGKMLMAKCRTLQEENEEIGNQASEGKMHELAMKLALQKSQNSQLRSQFEGLQKHMEGLTNDVERSNETVLMLQDKLEEKDQEIQRLEYELQQKNLEDGRSDAAFNRNDNNETIAGEATN